MIHDTTLGEAVSASDPPSSSLLVHRAHQSPFAVLVSARRSRVVVAVRIAEHVDRFTAANIEPRELDAGASAHFPSMSSWCFAANFRLSEFRNPAGPAAANLEC